MCRVVFTAAHHPARSFPTNFSPFISADLSVSDFPDPVGLRMRLPPSILLVTHRVYRSAVDLFVCSELTIPTAQPDELVPPIRVDLVRESRFSGSRP